MLRRLKTPLRYMNKTLPNTLSCSTGRVKSFKTRFFMSVFTLRDDCQSIKGIPIFKLSFSLPFPFPLLPPISLSLSFLLFPSLFQQDSTEWSKNERKKADRKA